MNEEEDQDGEKTEEPSQTRIDEFRKRGEVASSKEMTSVLMLAASLLTLTLSIVYVYEVLAEFMEWLYMVKIDTAFTTEALALIGMKVVNTFLKCTAPVFLVALCIAIFANVAQIGFLFSPEVLEFKPDRINPINGMKKLFSMRSFLEAVKGFFKFLFIMAIVYYFMEDELTSFRGFFHLDFVATFMKARWTIAKLGFSIVAGLAIIAAFDFAYQKMSYKKKLMMTREQAKREHKEKEGSPEVRQRIRSIQKEMAQKRMISEIPNADVIVTNPTHISIIIKYDQTTMISPEVIGKGADHLALRIREIAKEHDIPIVENVPLARSLYKTVKVGQGVPRGLYKAVAEVLAFVYKLKRKKKALS